MKFVDDSKKEIHWWNRNYFWVGTIFYIMLIIVIFACCLCYGEIFDEKSTGFLYSLSSFYNGFLGNFIHSSWEHCLHNMLGISFVSFYLERRYGTIPFLTLIFGFSFIIRFGGVGSSIVWFALYGFVLIDYLFSLRKTKRNWSNIIVGAVVLILEFIRAGFYDTPSGGIGYNIYPYQLLNNAGHFYGFIFGLTISLAINIVAFLVEKRNGNFNNEVIIEDKEKTKSKNIITLIISISFAVFIAIGSIIPMVLVKQRDTFTIEYVCLDHEISDVYITSITKEDIDNPYKIYNSSIKYNLKEDGRKTDSEFIKDWKNLNSIDDKFSVKIASAQYNLSQAFWEYNYWAPYQRALQELGYIPYSQSQTFIYYLVITQ